MRPACRSPRVLAVLDRLLMPNYLLSALQAINIQPGERLRSCPTMTMASIRFRGRGPRWPPRRSRPSTTSPPTTAPRLIPAAITGQAARPGRTMPRCLSSCPPLPRVFFGGNAAGTAAAPTPPTTRGFAVTAQYCQPWLRPMETYTLSIPRDVARTVSDDIQRMIGYSIHPPFVGAVDGLHPLRLLEQPQP